MVKVGRMLIEGSTDMEQNDWDYNMYHLNAMIKEKNPTGHWKVIGMNLGWNNAKGYKYVKAYIGSYLIHGVLPSTDCSFKIYNFGKGFMISNSHHDAMGEKYYIMPIAVSTFNVKRTSMLMHL